MVYYEKSRKFNNDHTVTITLSYTFETSDFVIDELPSNCSMCPVGYACNNGNNGNNETPHIPCGRRIPLDDKIRSPECKLISIEQWLKSMEGQQILSLNIRQHWNPPTIEQRKKICYDCRLFLGGVCDGFDEDIKKCAAFADCWSATKG